MTYSITRSFNYIRPIFFIDGRTSKDQPCKDRYQGGIENTDRTLALLEPTKTTAKVETFRVVRHDGSEAVDCHNYQSALAIAERRAPELRPSKGEATLSVTAFVSPSGRYYVMHGNQRLDCSNQATALYYVRNGVSVSVMLEASLATLSK